MAEDVFHYLGAAKHAHGVAQFLSWKAVLADIGNHLQVPASVVVLFQPVTGQETCPDSGFCRDALGEACFRMEGLYTHCRTPR